MHQQKGGPRFSGGDWENSKRRWMAFWERSLFDRPVMRVSAALPPSEEATGLYQPCYETDAEKEWTNIHQIIRRNRAAWAQTRFYGEAFAALDHKWSLGEALLFGCKGRYNSFAAWCDPVPCPEDTCPEIRFEKGGPAWNWMIDAVRTAAAESGGDFFVRTDWGNFTGDTLCAIRGDTRLMMDFIENRSWLKSACEAVTEGLIDFYDALYTAAQVPELEGSLNYLSCWSPEKTIALDCDISCMLSQSDFETFFLPGIAQAARHVRHTIYHLDGPGALRHLPRLLAEPAIDAIQWVPGAGHEEIAQWTSLLQEIQSAGKALLIQISPEELPLVQRLLSPEGLAVSLWCKDPAEAQRCMDFAENWLH